MDLIEKGIEKGLIELSEDKKQIRYVHQNKKRNFSNPEEQVQAEAFLRLILIYSYPVERIKQYVTVKMGSTSKEADIIVYNDNECTKPLIVVECKKGDVSELEFEEAINQAAAYAYAISGTIKYLWVTSGILNKYFVIDKESDVKQSIPVIPPFGVTKVQPYRYVKGGRKSDEQAGDDLVKQQFEDIKKIDENELTRRFAQAHKALWAGGELNPSEAFDELDKLIFCKIWDERMERKKGEPYNFQIFKEPIPRNATEEEKEKIEEKISKELFKRIKKIYAEGKKQDPEVFKDDIRLNHTKVRTVVGYLESVNLSETDLDSKGKAFETFMGSYFRGDFGQFFTPRPIVKFIVNSLPITNKSRVLDTSCGSGGFLLYALDKIRNKAEIMAKEGYFDKSNPVEYNNWKEYWHNFAKNYLYGIEINEQIARTAKMNMIIHDDGHTNVISADGLLIADQLQKKSKNSEFKYGSFDFIITNPPFGSSVKLTERAYLKQYNLGKKDVNWLDTKNSTVQNRANQSTEVLFIEQCWNFLEEGGFLAIVIPDGILTNSSLQYVRDNIEEWYRIVGVVSLPQTAFTNTGAGVKSSVLFLRKWSSKTTEDYQSLKKQIQDEIKKEKDYLRTVENIENEKKKIIKSHKGFENTNQETDKKKIEKTEEFLDWKKEITDLYNQKISDLKEDLIDIYISRKQQKLKDYPIFMAIAEDIGYDATGRNTNNNELDIIEEELGKFISHIEQTEKI